MLMCRCMLNRRTNILFDDESLKRLSKIARRDGVSIGRLVRKAIRQVYFDQEDRTLIKEAVARIKSSREKIKGKVDYKELINYGRKH